VTFSVQNGVGLTTDSSATVATDGLLGGKYLALAEGGDEKNIPPGGTVTITQGSVNLEALLGKYIFGGTGKASTPKSGDARQGGGDGIAPLK
jgi:phospholipid/cholesterol/gamma-HCH transport system substrate-binding protein